VSYSPYSSPPESIVETGTVPTAPPSGRPTGVTVLAILSIVFGITGLFGLAISAAMMLAAGASFGPNPIIDKMAESTAYQVFYYVTLFIGFVFTILLFIGGIALWKMSKLGRHLLVSYAVYAVIAAIVINTVNVLFVFLPAIQEPDNSTQVAVQVMSIVGSVVGGLVGLIFPIAILVYFSRPAVKDAVANWGSEIDPVTSETSNA